MRRHYKIFFQLYPTSAGPLYQVIEVIHTLDGPRDRVTASRFYTEDEARAFVKELETLAL